MAHQTLCVFVFLFESPDWPVCLYLHSRWLKLNKHGSKIQGQKLRPRSNRKQSKSQQATVKQTTQKKEKEGHAGASVQPQLPLTPITSPLTYNMVVIGSSKDSSSPFGKRLAANGTGTRMDTLCPVCFQHHVAYLVAHHLFVLFLLQKLDRQEDQRQGCQGSRQMDFQQDRIHTPRADEALEGTLLLYVFHKHLQIANFGPKRTHSHGPPQTHSTFLFHLFCNDLLGVWMSDKPVIQQQLSETLSSLILRVPRSSVMDFISTFWQTMCGEWHGIDRLRYRKSFRSRFRKRWAT